MNCWACGNPAKIHKSGDTYTCTKSCGPHTTYMGMHNRHWAKLDMGVRVNVSRECARLKNADYNREVQLKKEGKWQGSYRRHRQ